MYKANASVWCLVPLWTAKLSSQEWFIYGLNSWSSVDSNRHTLKLCLIWLNVYFSCAINKHSTCDVVWTYIPWCPLICKSLKSCFDVFFPVNCVLKIIQNSFSVVKEKCKITGSLNSITSKKYSSRYQMVSKKRKPSITWVDSLGWDSGMYVGIDLYH